MSKYTAVLTEEEVGALATALYSFQEYIDNNLSDDQKIIEEERTQFEAADAIVSRILDSAIPETPLTVTRNIVTHVIRDEDVFLAHWIWFRDHAPGMDLVAIDGTDYSEFDLDIREFLSELDEDFTCPYPAFVETCKILKEHGIERVCVVQY